MKLQKLITLLLVLAVLLASSGPHVAVAKISANSSDIAVSAAPASLLRYADFTLTNPNGTANYVKVVITMSGGYIGNFAGVAVLDPKGSGAYADTYIVGNSAKSTIYLQKCAGYGANGSTPAHIRVYYWTPGVPAVTSYSFGPNCS